MKYMFPLMLFYRACYKNSGVYFRATRRADLPLIAQWITDMLGRPAADAASLLPLLQWEWDTTVDELQRGSWIAMVGQRCLFLLEADLTAGRGSEVEYYITGPDLLFRYSDLNAVTHRISRRFLMSRRM